MSDTYGLWCLVQNDGTPFSVGISSTLSIGKLKEEISKNVSGFASCGWDPTDIVLTKARYIMIFI